MTYMYTSYQADLINRQKGLSLLEDASKQNMLPSRLEHVWILIKTGVNESFTLIGVIARIAVVALTTLLAPFFWIFSSEKNKGREFAYSVLSLVILDPLNILLTIATSTSCVTSSIFGLISPTFALTIRQKTESMEMDMLRVRMNCLDLLKLKPEEFSPSENEIKPEAATIYLGEDRCLEVAAKQMSEPERTRLDKKIRTLFVSFLDFITEKDPELCKRIFAPDADKNSIIGNTSQQDFCDVIDSRQYKKMHVTFKKIVSKTDIKEIERMHCSIHLKIFGTGSTVGERVERAAQTLSEKAKISGKELTSRTNQLSALLSKRLRFGQMT